MLLSKQDENNACVWYLINILLDCTLGVIFEWILVRLIEIFARKFEIDTLISGCYYTRRTFEYDDYHINYWIWFIQCFIWCLISSLMKVLMYLILIIFPEKLENFGTFLLKDLDSYPRAELVVVMVIVPFILNCFQFWVVDNFLKESDESRISRMAKGQKLLGQVRWEDYVHRRKSGLEGVANTNTKEDNIHESESNNN